MAETIVKYSWPSLYPRDILSHGSRKIVGKLAEQGSWVNKAAGKQGSRASRESQER